MMLFLDTANPSEVQRLYLWGCFQGVTTNQKIMLASGVPYTQKAYEANIQHICQAANGDPVSVELTSSGGADAAMIEEAEHLFSLNPNQIVIKVPMWRNGQGLRIIKRLYDRRIPTNATCLMSAIQGILAADAGAKYVSLFFNRMNDYSDHWYTKFEFEYLHRYLKGRVPYCQLIAGSIRKPSDVISCFEDGADIVTVTPKVAELLPYHEATEKTIAEFDAAWKEYTGK